MKTKKILAQFGLISKPTFLILGAQKAGTSSLFGTLNQHSLIYGSSSKEVHYFDNEDWYKEKKIIDYHLYFPLKYQMKKNAHAFEASPSYLIHPEVAKRLFNYNPQLKFIVLLRNPVERAISAWKMYHYHFNESERKFLIDSRDFDDAMREEIDEFNQLNRFIDFRCYVKRGMYYTQIENYLNYFSKSQFLFLESNDLKNKFEESMIKIFDFLRVPFEKLSSEDKNKSTISFNKEDHQNIILELKDLFKEENQKLYDLIGETFDWDE